MAALFEPMRAGRVGLWRRNVFAAVPLLGLLAPPLARPFAGLPAAAAGPAGRWGSAARCRSGRLTACRLPSLARVSSAVRCISSAAAPPRYRERFSYYVLHKPRGVVSTRGTHEGGTVYDVYRSFAASGGLPDSPPSHQIGLVGRLDKDTSGLIMFTDDNLFMHKLLNTHSCSKVYTLVVAGNYSDDHPSIEQMREPLRYERLKTNGGRETWTRPAEVSVVRTWREEVPHPKTPAWWGDRTEVRVRLGEGRYHQIRRLCRRAEVRLRQLRRDAVGAVALGDLPEGALRALTEAEEQAMLRTLDLPAGRTPRESATWFPELRDSGLEREAPQTPLSEGPVATDPALTAQAVDARAA